MRFRFPRIKLRISPPLIATLAGLFIATSLFAADAVPGTAPTDNNTKLETKKNVWELYQAGGFFMFPLTACSVLAVAIIIERFVAHGRDVRSPD